MILVTGVTGRQGGALALQLLERGYQVRGLSRDPSKPKAFGLAEQGVKIVKGDFRDLASLEHATEGAYGMFLNTPNTPDQAAMGRNAVDAAKTTGIKHMVYSASVTTDPGKGIADGPKVVVEQYLRDSGVEYTLLRPSMFMDNYNGAQTRILSDGIRDPRGASSLH